MVQVSEKLTDPWIDRAVEQLDNEKRFGIALVAFSRTVVDRPENWKKIENSFAGNAVDLHRRLALRELQMWCCRVWDKQGHSLRGLAPRLKEKSAQIADAHLRAHRDCPEEDPEVTKLPASIEAFCESVEIASASRLLVELRIVRDEHFAHLLEGVSARRRSRVNDPPELGYTYNEVLDLAEQSVALISEAIFVWRFHRHRHSDSATAKLLTKYYESYWRLLPNFAELEKTEQSARIARQQKNLEGRGPSDNTGNAAPLLADTPKKGDAATDDIGSPR